MTQRRRKKKTEWDWHWRSLAAVVYLIICFTDFVGMPLYREWSHNKLTHQQIMTDARSMGESAAQIEALRILREDRPWTPLTNEVFHLAFGAILGVSALPMNRRRRREDEYGDDPLDPMPPVTRGPEPDPMPPVMPDAPEGP